MTSKPEGLTPQQRSELHQLVSAVCEGQASATERARLERLVLSHGEARAFYVQYIHMYAAVVRYNLSVEPGETESVEPDTAGSNRQSSVQPLTGAPLNAEEPALGQHASPLLGFLAASIRNSLPTMSSFSLLWAALVASLAWALVAVWIVPWWRAQSPAAANPAATSPIGRLAGAENCQWRAGLVPQVGGPLELAPLDITAGTAEIALAGGANVCLGGPARLQLESPGRVRLEHGKLFARVPKRAVGFTVVTPCAEIIDLGTEFAVEVDAAGKTQVHTLRGQVEVKPLARRPAAAKRGQTVSAGQAVQVVVDGGQSSPIAFDMTRFDALRHSGSSTVAAPGAAALPRGEFAGVIWLGNLFDDPRGTPLAAAVGSDEFRAVAEVGDLGIDRVLLGGDALKQISPGVRFDFSNLGWGPGHYGQISNDTWTDFGVLPGADFGPDGGIQTLGKRIGMKEPKTEEGIGSHASALVTFNLDDIRAAGELGAKPLVFHCDRAGINDSFSGAGSVHMAVLACDRRGVLKAIVDGEPARAADSAGIWSITSPIGEPIVGNGRFARFEMPLPAQVKFLILAVTQAGDGNGCDAAVWSGARLETIKSSK